MSPEWYECAAHWPKIEGWVASALDHGGVMLWPDDVLRGLLKNEMKLWLVYDDAELKACCVTQFANYPRLRCCSVIVISGSDAETWLHFSEAVEAWAKSLGCKAVEGVGRKGWERVAGPHGYKPVVTIFRKDLN